MERPHFENLRLERGDTKADIIRKAYLIGLEAFARMTPEEVDLVGRELLGDEYKTLDELRREERGR